MLFQTINIGSPTYNTQTVQQISGWIFFAGIGLAVGAIGLYALYKIIQKMNYNYHVTVIEKLGSGEIQFFTKAKQVKDADDNIMIHYLGVGYSQKWAEFANYLRTVKTKMFGFIPGSSKGFTVYKIGEKVIPIKVKDNPGLEPIDYDMFNYMQWRVRANIAKYARRDKLMQLLPIIGLGMVVLAFILGSLFWGKHVESVAKMIINSAISQSQAILEKAGSVQIIPGG